MKIQIRCCIPIWGVSGHHPGARLCPASETSCSGNCRTLLRLAQLGDGARVSPAAAGLPDERMKFHGLGVVERAAAGASYTQPRSDRFAIGNVSGCAAVIAMGSTPAPGRSGTRHASRSLQRMPVKHLRIPPHPGFPRGRGKQRPGRARSPIHFYIPRSRTVRMHPPRLCASAIA